MLWQEGRSKISAVLVFVLLFSLLIPVMVFGAPTVQFKDITDSYAQKEISSLVDQGVISGYEDGSFQPGKVMSRAELAKIIVLSLGLQENADKAAAFQDVDKKSWYNGFVGALVESGITQGTSETTFSPDAKVTREELVVFFIRAMGLEETAKKVPADSKLSDLKEVSSWAQAQVSLAFKIGFVNGIESGDGSLKFSPKDNADRQALARLAYEFKTNKAKFVNKANQLVNLDEAVISSLSAVSNTSVEVVFNKEMTSINAADFTFDNGLSVTAAEMKTDSKTTAILTTSVQAAGALYKLSYKGKDTGITFTGFAVIGGFGGGGGGGSGGSKNTKSDLEKLNSGGTYESLKITSSGTLGPADGAGKTIVSGTLTLDPGAEGEITLQNVEANNIVVASGSPNSIKLQNTIIKQLRVAATAQTNPVRIETLHGATVTNTEIQSNVIVESTAGSLGTIKVGSGAAGKQIELRGAITGDVTVDAPGSLIRLTPPKAGGTTSVSNLNICANSTITVGTGTALSNVSITSPNTSLALTGEGEIRSVTVAKEAEGSSLNLPKAGTIISTINLHANIKLDGDAAAIGSAQIVAAPGVKIEAPKTLIDLLKEKASQAIAAIGEFTEYSAELEARIIAVETVAKNAILLGVPEADITGFSTKLVDAKRKITAFALEAVSKDLKIGFADNDSSTAVTQNISLPISAPRGIKIHWETSNEAVVSNNGVVTRPAIGEADAQIILTATLSKSNQELNREFVIIVLALKSSEPPVPTLESLISDDSSVVFQTYGETKQLKISAKYSDGSTLIVTKDVEYNSSNPSVATVSSEGIITARANGNTDITVSYEGKQVIVPVTVSNSDVFDAPQLIADAGDGQVLLSWNKVGTNVTYNVYSFMSDGWKALASITGTTYAVTSLNNGTTYDFYVKAVKNGVGKNSNVVSVSPMQKTQTPTVTGNVYTNGWMLSGIAEADSFIKLTQKDGTYLTSGYARWDGTFFLKQNIYDSYIKLTLGEELQLTAKTSNKRTSDPVIVTVKNVKGQTKQPTVIGAVYETTNRISGYADPGARVTLKNEANGYTISETASDYDGQYYIYPGQMKIGDQLAISATMVGQVTSDPVNVLVQALPKTEKPTVTGNVYTNGWLLSGKAEVGSYSTEIRLSKQDGTNVAITNANRDGSFTIQSNFSYNSNVSLSVGEELLLTAQIYEKKTSDPVKITVLNTTGQTQAPTVTSVVYETMTGISGKAEPGTYIRLMIGSSGSIADVTTATYDGRYTFNMSPWRYSEGTQLSLTAILIGKATSDPVNVTVQAAPRTETPTVTGNVYTNGWLLNGKVEKATSRTEIWLSRKDGTYVANVDANWDGSFTLQSNSSYNVNEMFSVGEELLLTAKNYYKKVSDPVIVVVQDTAGKTKAPTITSVVYERMTVISGYAEPGAIIKLKVGPSGYIDNITTANYDGSYYFYMSPWRYTQGTQLTLIADVLGKATSDPVQVIVQADR
ncbi:hypothetical protein DVH26_34225 [Paenibacillus sp. H1-7]|uniref:S-layer homology domain-containing protein n=1 Tax=Paenibacillus sp. H1-7 TaxID=2282849 RepID=UPI001EF96272|nr:S-layer homology domain-containing protein [Paenibacillus sp. H1-7]ULL19045.1 hypothetical protein DVH26_34225 [Paenibacillus sp. H1-7]